MRVTAHIVGLLNAMTIDDVKALHVRLPASPSAPRQAQPRDCVLACKEEDRAMPIGITDRIVALFASLTREDVDMLPPVRRAQFAELCRHWANFAEIRPDAPRSGVLVALRTRRRDE